MEKEKNIEEFCMKKREHWLLDDAAIKINSKLKGQPNISVESGTTPSNLTNQEKKGTNVVS